MHWMIVVTLLAVQLLNPQGEGTSLNRTGGTLSAHRKIVVVRELPVVHEQRAAIAVRATSGAKCPLDARCGYAAHYGVGTMERAAALNGLPAVRCMVASSYWPVGTWLLVASKFSSRPSLCRVSDPTKKEHIALVRGRGIIIEFGAANIKQFCNFDKVEQDLPSACPVTVWLAN